MTTRVRQRTAYAVAVFFRVSVGLVGLASFAHGDEPAKALTVTPHLDLLKDAVKGTAAEIKDNAVGAVKAAVGTAPGAKPPAASAAAPVNDPAARMALLRKKTLREEDFIEHDETNRDPFKSFLRIFVEKSTSTKRVVPAIFDKFALEELTLIAIISGDANPRAMFRDPSGLGQTIKRGDYLSKIGARITKILSDRVVLELAEITPSGETKPIEKAILVNPEGAQK